MVKPTESASAELSSAEVFVNGGAVFPDTAACPGNTVSASSCGNSSPASCPENTSLAAAESLSRVSCPENRSPAVSSFDLSPEPLESDAAFPDFSVFSGGSPFPEGLVLPDAAESAAPPSFADFALGVYPFLELQFFHRAYYRVLEAFAAGRIRRLIVTMPPQHGKSVGATTLLPAYVLGLDPDQRVAIASYSGTLASKFNRRVQRILESQEYAAFFPETTIKKGAKPPSYIRTADEVEIIGRRGSLLSVGREGSLTGNRVDCFILDDLYKDALEANSPLVRANCWEWYTSVVRTRMHNASRELIVFTRWHEEDLIGTLTAREPVEELRTWSQVDALPSGVWLHLNFEALKTSPPTEVDPRRPGEALWEEQHGAALLAAKRRLDPLQFEAMYQGRPSAREGLLYGLNFGEYDDLPHEIVRRANYTDTADTGDDYLCSLSYAVDADGVVYITDAVYSREPMEATEPLVAEMLARSDTRQAAVESNNGGRGFARAVQALAPGVRVEWFHQGGNKEARILSNSATALHLVRFPRGWNLRWPELYAHLTTYRRKFRVNRWHDAADVVTGIVEREAPGRDRKRVRGVRFL
ncbi:phage terminase large subunit [uncultured Alistipes sp.]|uniref:phage terminase large subunit n=1 Tax=uncultured Alistipes sp. TaxID=538949 RepID=UPI002587CE08|nr:phage terminase large subunit [uncultured Alistipes sp.]